MSRWQLKSTHKRHLLLLKVYGVCFIFHCVALVWIFFVHNNDPYTVSLTLHKHIDYSSPILFTPIPVKPAQKETQLSQTNSVQKPIAAKEKAAEKPATVATALKKVEPIQKKIEPPKSIPQQKVEQKIIEKAVEKKEEAKPSNPAPIKNNSAPVNNAPDNAHLSSNYKEVEALRRTALLQKELSLRWKPPAGVPAQTSCEVSFCVNDNGKVNTINVIKSSGIRMYDISARNALVAMKMPQWTYGRTVTIIFI